jgi:hypothetical protein
VAFQVAVKAKLGAVLGRATSVVIVGKGWARSASLADNEATEKPDYAYWLEYNKRVMSLVPQCNESEG